MAKGPEIPQTDSAEIEILIERLKQNKLEQRDVELIERLLRTVLVLVNLLQRKNISIKRLRESWSADDKVPAQAIPGWSQMSGLGLSGSTL